MYILEMLQSLFKLLRRGIDRVSAQNIDMDILCYEIGEETSKYLEDCIGIPSNFDEFNIIYGASSPNQDLKFKYIVET